MKTKIIILLLAILLSGCSWPKSKQSEALSTPGAAAAGEPCPANPDQAQALAERLPRMHADGFCSIHFLPGNTGAMIGVQMIYPEGWFLSLINPDETGLLFEQNGKQIFFAAYSNTLTLEEADKATYSFEGSPPEPVVRTEEVVKDRMVQAVGDKQSLILTTTLNDQTIRRYFLVRENTVYVFQLNVLANNVDNTGVIPTIEEMIGWLQFDK